MKTIESIDLWTEQYPKGHEFECIKGAFIDGVSSKIIPYDSIEIIRNCDCKITNNANLNISNKHNAVIFYKNLSPIRLLVFNYIGDLSKLLAEIFNQKIEKHNLKDLLNKFNVKITKEQLNSILSQSILEEIDIGSCDNVELLNAMLGGSYSTSDIGFGNNTNPDFVYNKKIKIKYLLKTKSNSFNIKHKGAFINTSQSRIIPIQVNGKITQDYIKDLIKYSK